MKFEPWMELGLSEEEYKKPLAELPPEKRLCTFQILNGLYGMYWQPKDFNIQDKSCKNQKQPS